MKPLLIAHGIVALCLASCAKDGEAANQDPLAPGAAGETAAAGTPGATTGKPERKKEEVSEAVGDPLLPAGQTGKDEGLRLPNMLGLPEDRDLKATNPTTTASEPEQGGVISRPPVEKKE
ncbi:hypothetical protein OVA24_01185 [Luteolibacter sp. SL250]|uniref:hypothetical protein n=1 Tax=Luteolibacter sp. SL250 TaxID=2995170 RepID=UPI00226E76F3|nr:hypothetical protein [Luteolibacter sp. SL250]WAC19991.1 hypothetical protein OVA24_01185 [Luteolibacter sp. SL250]